MKFKLSLLSASLLLASNSWASDEPYYTIQQFDAFAEGAKFGPYPSAISEDGQFIGTYSLKASVSKEIDIGLPYTFNRECQFDNVVCDLEFEGSETSSDLSYENAYQQWRNAQSDISLGRSSSYASYFMGNALDCSGDSGLELILECSDEAQIPYTDDQTTDTKVTDVIKSDSEELFVTGYSSAPYVNGERDFVRRAFVKPNIANLGDEVQLLPEFTSNGGFTSAYKIQKVTYSDGTVKTLVVGSSSVSYPKDNDDYFKDCFFTDEYDYRYTLNDLVRCPGFDTQAWAWDVTDLVNGSSSVQEVIGFKIATEWLDDNEENQGNLTFSANAFDINKSGIAVGTSTFERYSNAEGGRQRAIIMIPNASGTYAKPFELTAATDDIEDQDDWIYNTWAVAITEQNYVVGNREYDTEKSRNQPIEFFTYAFDLAAKTGVANFPLLDKRVLSTKQRLAGESGADTGANSEAFAVNLSGIVVGKSDDYDQTHPVYEGTPRSQTAFIYDSESDQSWRLNDLICSRVEGDVKSPLIRIRNARVINDDGTILAEGFTYSSPQDYRLKNNATETSFKLTLNPSYAESGETANDSPNCWESDLLFEEDEPYERKGAASFWLWIFALPLLLLRRLNK